MAKVHALSTIKTSSIQESSLDNPQILFSHLKSVQFLKPIHLNENVGLQLLKSAREALEYAVHYRQWIIAGLVLIAFWQAYRIPKVNIHQRFVE